MCVKASWAVGSLLGVVPVGAGFSTAGWVLLNTVTIGMAGAGIAVALALVPPWDCGCRHPGHEAARPGQVSRRRPGHGQGYGSSTGPYGAMGWPVWRAQ
ncbi:hypothetical protein [Streptomyces sp. NPDC007070]|uniref:hypothetical protein n=1 Tax=Streptomyces sp. NPDC007070 TaxID=3154312 RepID=UPI0034017FEF